MQWNPIRPAAALALLACVAAPDLASAQERFVDTPPPPGAVCPAIAEDYPICREDPMSGNCRDFVAAAGALSDLYLFHVQREPGRARELQNTLWWGCGSAPLVELKALLVQLDTPAARAVLAEEPYRSLPGAPGGTRAGAAQDSGAGLGSPDTPECDSIFEPAERNACEQRALADAEARHEREVASCKAQLEPVRREELLAAEAAWQRTLAVECPIDEDETDCLTTATLERSKALAQSHPECATGHAATLADDDPGRVKGGKRTGMLPARWTPPQGESQEVPFSFASLGRDTRTGTMHTTLGPGGEGFDGDYLRIEQSTKGDLVAAVSIGWSGPEWQLWKHNPDGGWTEEGVSVGEFARFYTGKVVAWLRGNRGHAMRCQLELKEAEKGLLGGGSGRCQVTDGGSLSLAF